EELVVDPANPSSLRQRPEGLLVARVHPGIDPVEAEAREQVTGRREPGLEREALAPVVGVHDDPDLDRVRVDATSLPDRGHLDEGDGLAVEQHQPGAEVMLAPALETPTELARHAFAWQGLARVRGRHDCWCVADREQGLEIALL